MDDGAGDEIRDAADAVAMLLGRGANVPERHTRTQLEVHHVWGNAVLSSRVFGRGEEVRLGTDTGDRWSFLGVDMGFAPRPLALALRAIPLWTDHERTWRDDFVVPAEDLPGGRTHTLVEVRGDAQVLRVPRGAELLLRRGEEAVDLEDLVRGGGAERTDDGVEVPLSPGLVFVVRVGGAILVGGIAAAAARVAPARLDRDDLPALGLMGAGLGLAAAVALTLGLAGPPEREVAVAELPEEYVVMLIDETPPAPAPPDEGARAPKGAEGKRGPTKPRPEKSTTADRPARKRDLDRRVAERAGVLGAMGGELDEVLGSASLSDGLVSGARGLVGAVGVGTDGLGRRGRHLGGGGEAEGLGSFAVGDRDGIGGPGLPRDQKRDGEIGAATGDPIVLGTLQASEVDEVVKRHMQQIRYCYQRELQRNPGLGGKVVVKFTIAADGSVASASPKASSVEGDGVETCLVGRFQRMQFPEPRGGGIVVVSYPLVFSAG